MNTSAALHQHSIDIRSGPSEISEAQVHRTLHSKEGVACG